MTINAESLVVVDTQYFITNESKTLVAFLCQNIEQSNR